MTTHVSIDHAYVARLYRQGLTIKVIGERIGVSSWKIRQALIAANETRRQPPGWAKAEERRSAAKGA